MSSSIEIKGVCTHNLKNLDANFPQGLFTVVTGLSGSGKSSLVFDTLYGESYRRYVDSLSSFARQYLKAMARPEIASAHNMLPAIALKQNQSSANVRSTVGSLCEISDLLGALYAHLSTIICPDCDEVVLKSTPDSTIKDVNNTPGFKSILILATLQDQKTIKATKPILAELSRSGFTRLYHQGSVVKIEEFGGKFAGTQLVIDRISLGMLDEGKRDPRLKEALALAFKAGKGKVEVVDTKTGLKKSYSQDYVCQGCQRAFLAPSVGLFSFNHPYGACKECQGFGSAPTIDWRRVFPDMAKGLNSAGIAPWNFGTHKAWYKVATKTLEAEGIDPNTPFDKYTQEQMLWLKDGCKGRFSGVRGYFKWLDSKRYKPHYRIHASRFRKYQQCPSCHGGRLRPESLACKIVGKSIADCHEMSLSELACWLDEVESEANRVEKQETKRFRLVDAFQEISSRLKLLNRIGLGYLSLLRKAKTLSGGELQRIHLTRCLGNSLTDTLYCLDEPTSGLHPQDTNRLIEIIQELQTQGNTVVAVEHDEQMIAASDRLIYLGPGAGRKGGNIDFEGDKADFKPKGDIKFPNPKVVGESFVSLANANLNNLKQVSCKFPVGRITGVCGVSGSGKSTLIRNTLGPILEHEFGKELLDDELQQTKISSVTDHFDDAFILDQKGLGKSSRSNIATYLGIYDEIRKTLAKTQGAISSSLTPSSFSFNTSGGRCETCKGMGTVTEELSFLGEMNVPCPDCEGRRFNDEVLSVRLKGLNLIEILQLTVDDAAEFFYNNKKIRTLLTQTIEMGLGYLTIGQPTSTFSGGEAQRLKLVQLLKETRSDKKACIILDEPSRGLSDFDVLKLFEQIRSLADQGNTILIIEHHTKVLQACDWIIELGPGAAKNGGQVIYEGTTKDFKNAKNSVTSPYLQGA